MRNPTETRKAKAHYPTLRRLQYFIGPSRPRPATARIAALVIETPRAPAGEPRRSAAVLRIVSGRIAVTAGDVFREFCALLARAAADQRQAVLQLEQGDHTRAHFQQLDEKARIEFLDPVGPLGEQFDQVVHLAQPRLSAAVAVAARLGDDEVTQHREGGIDLATTALFSQGPHDLPDILGRSEERRVGKEC